MASKSQKGRKIGRNRAKPSAKVYLTAGRALLNKKKKIARHNKRMAKQAAHHAAWAARKKLNSPISP